MKPSYVEHANISVTDVDDSIRFFLTALPDFYVRFDTGPEPDRWVHVGTDETYICVNQMPPTDNGEYQHHRPGVNHLGFVVDDVDTLHKRMVDAGYREGFIPSPHPYRKRVYFMDKDGMEYEFVEYYSSESAKRNAYP